MLGDSTWVWQQVVAAEVKIPRLEAIFLPLHLPVIVGYLHDYL